MKDNPYKKLDDHPSLGYEYLLKESYSTLMSWTWVKDKDLEASDTTLSDAIAERNTLLSRTVSLATVGGASQEFDTESDTAFTLVDDNLKDPIMDSMQEKYCAAVAEIKRMVSVSQDLKRRTEREAKKYSVNNVTSYEQNEKFKKDIPDEPNVGGVSDFTRALKKQVRTVDKLFGGEEADARVPESQEEENGDEEQDEEIEEEEELKAKAAKMDKNATYFDFEGLKADKYMTVEAKLLVLYNMTQKSMPWKAFFIANDEKVKHNEVELNLLKNETQETLKECAGLAGELRFFNTQARVTNERVHNEYATPNFLLHVLEQQNLTEDHKKAIDSLLDSRTAYLKKFARDDYANNGLGLALKTRFELLCRYVNEMTMLRETIKNLLANDKVYRTSYHATKSNTSSNEYESNLAGFKQAMKEAGEHDAVSPAFWDTYDRWEKKQKETLMLMDTSPNDPVRFPNPDDVNVLNPMTTLLSNFWHVTKSKMDLNEKNFNHILKQKMVKEAEKLKKVYDAEVDNRKEKAKRAAGNYFSPPPKKARKR